MTTMDEPKNAIDRFNEMLAEPGFEDVLNERQKSEADEMERQRVAAMGTLRRKRWLDIPKVYREEFVPGKSRMPPDVVKYAREWIPVKNCRGIGLSGETGLGKTRLLVRVLHRIQCSYVFIPMTKFSKAVRKQYDDELKTAHDAEEVLEAALSAKVLMFDDLGKESATAAVCEAVYDVVEDRVSRRAPILWTTELNGDELRTHYQMRGPAIVRRLTEFSWSPTRTSPK